MKFNTLTEACYAWVNEFNFIPGGVVEKLDGFNDYGESMLNEITPPRCGDRVWVTNGKWKYRSGEIVKSCYKGEDDLYLVELDDVAVRQPIDKDDLEIEMDDHLPMWSTMFAFKEQIDNEWLSGRFGENGLQLMADCGFRIYEQEDYEYIFGIDGCGYDFYSAHWIPLYKARGLHWHEVDDTEKEEKHEEHA